MARSMDPPLDVAAHRAEVEGWRRERYERLRRPMSWLSLVGLSWLRDGENRIGSDPANELVVPAGPPLAGRLVLRDGEVTAHAEPNGLTHDGQPVDGLRLVDDVAAGDDDPTLLELGRLRMCLIERGGRMGLRTWDTEAPALGEFDGIPHYPVDAAWRLVARFEPANGRTITVPDVLGIATDEESPGTVLLDVGGATHSIDALPGGDDGELWLVFGDETNGDTTYGGGRFLYTPPPAADGTVVVDFNVAYNPPCVFSPYATCPLPPPQNRLAARIEAGERLLTLSHSDG